MNSDNDWMSDEEWREELDRSRQQEARMNQMLAYHVTKVLKLLGWIVLAVLLLLPIW